VDDVIVKASASRRVSYFLSMLFSLKLWSYSIELLTCCGSYMYCLGLARDAEKVVFITFP